MAPEVGQDQRILFVLQKATKRGRWQELNPTISSKARETIIKCCLDACQSHQRPHFVREKLIEEKVEEKEEDEDEENGEEAKKARVPASGF